MTDAAIVLQRVTKVALIATGGGVLLCIVALVIEGERFLHSYLFAFCFWTGISLGCLGYMLLNDLTGGRWGWVLRRIFEAGALVLPAAFVLMLPIFFGISRLYEWARPEAQAQFAEKALYLNPSFFVARSVLYFLIWSALALVLRRKSRSCDRQGIWEGSAWSGPGLLLYVLTASFAAIDWTMSLEPEWSSTMYGVLAISGQGLSALAGGVIVLSWLRECPPFAAALTAEDSHDLGNLLLVFVLFSAYVNFSQFLIIWSGNLPEEAAWYLRRISGGWDIVAAMLAVFHFAIPFVLLLSRRFKRDLKALSWIAMIVLVFEALEQFWFVLPVFEKRAFPHLSDFGTFLVIGGIWVSVFAYGFKQAPLLPATAFSQRLEELRGAAKKGGAEGSVGGIR